MGVRYFFDQIGRDGSTMGSRINGAPYTVEQALAWALDDVRAAVASRLGTNRPADTSHPARRSGSRIEQQRANWSRFE